MAVSLSKGGNVSLSKETRNLSALTVGLGWDVRQTDGAAFDLDASAFVVGQDDKVLSDAHFIFYNNKVTPDGSVVYSGDNRTGEGADDDETIKIDFARLSAEVKKVVIGVTIHEAQERRQNFGLVSNAYARVINDANGKELARYDLSEDCSTTSLRIASKKLLRRFLGS